MNFSIGVIFSTSNWFLIQGLNKPFSHFDKKSLPQLAFIELLRNLKSAFLWMMFRFLLVAKICCALKRGLSSIAGNLCISSILGKRNILPDLASFVSITEIKLMCERYNIDMRF